MATSADIYAGRVRAAENPGAMHLQNVQLKGGVSVGAGFYLVIDGGFGKIPAAAIHATAEPGGMCRDNADNTAGADGALTVACEDGTFDFVNSAVNPCSQADVGNPVFAEDHQTIGNLNTAGCKIGKLVEFNPAGAMPGRVCRVRIDLST